MAITKMGGGDAITMSDSQLGAHLILTRTPLQVEWQIYLAGMQAYQIALQAKKMTQGDMIELAIAERVTRRLHSRIHADWRAAVSDYYNGKKGSVTFSDVGGVRMVSYHVGGDVYGPVQAVRPPNYGGWD